MQEDSGRLVKTLAGGGTLVVVRDYDAMSLLAAEIVVATVTDNPGTALTLPTGGTPRGMYDELVSRIRQGEISFDRIDFFCLDDYLGKGIDDDTSLTSWLDDVFFTPADLHGPNIHFRAHAGG
jgi:glucosamine-6-phosphate deaminase